MRKLLFLCSLALLASTAPCQSLIGKWRIAAKKRPTMTAIIQFKDARMGSIRTGTSPAIIEQAFTYKIKGGLLTLTPSGSVKIGGKPQAGPSAQRPLFLNLKWKNKDLVLVQSSMNGKPAGDWDEMRRVK